MSTLISLSPTWQVDETVRSLWELLDHAQPVEGFLPLQEIYLHPDISMVHRAAAQAAATGVPSGSSGGGAADPTQDGHSRRLVQDFRPREGPEGASALPDFSLDTLLGGGGPGGSLTSVGVKAGGGACMRACVLHAFLVTRVSPLGTLRRAGAIWPLTRPRCRRPQRARAERDRAVRHWPLHL